MGDAAKFYDVDKLNGYIFTLDDDLVVPKSYIKDMLMYIEGYNCPVTLHGKVFGNRPVEDYFKSFTGNYTCLGTVTKDVRVDVGGTGVMGWRSDMLKISLSDFLIPNMADVWFAKLCYEQGQKIMCLHHDAGYIKYIKPNWTIWRNEPRTGIQTEILNSFL
jgi:hypothetical protein